MFCVSVWWRQLYFFILFKSFFFFLHTQFPYACTHRWGHLASIPHRLETPYKDKNHPLNLILAYIIFSLLTREKKRRGLGGDMLTHTQTHWAETTRQETAKRKSYYISLCLQVRVQTESPLSFFFFFNIPAQRATFTEINCCYFHLLISSIHIAMKWEGPLMRSTTVPGISRHIVLMLIHILHVKPWKQQPQIM